MRRFLGLDSSTQSLTATVIDLDTSAVVVEQSVGFEADLPQYGCPAGVRPHADPLVKHSDPRLWAAALDLLLARLQTAGVDFSTVLGISGSGQQHGSVYLDERFLNPKLHAAASDLASLVAPLLTRDTAPIWMDSSTSAECAEITRAVGGADYVRRVTGSPAVERFTGPQIRRFWKTDPAGYERTTVIHLVSSLMASLLAGRSVGIDLGDGAGMNLLSLPHACWDPALVTATAPGLAGKLPPAVPAWSIAGEVSPYFVRRYGFRAGTPVVAWSGDNPNSLIGVGGWQPGTAVVSLGTSDTYFAAMSAPHVDPDGYGHVFGNPAGGFMSLICFKNGALARQAVREKAGVDWAGFEACLGRTPVGNHGNLVLPYFIPEITPLVLAARPVYAGSPDFVAGRDTAAAVRGVVEAQAMRLKLHSAWIADRPAALRVTGGGAANTAICQVLADVFDARVERLETGNSAALGAALRAAHAVEGRDWADLTAAFCRPAAGLDVHPNAANVATYAKLLPRYAELAAKHGK